MIYVSKCQLKEIEYIIQQSIKGNHVLFDIEQLRRVFWHKSPLLTEGLSLEDAYTAEHHIEKVILRPTLAQKRAYLDCLDVETFNRVVKTYFQIVENNLSSRNEIFH